MSTITDPAPNPGPDLGPNPGPDLGPNPAPDPRPDPEARQHGYYYDEMSVGMTATHEKTISDHDVRQFAELTGDTNPLHLDDAFAATTVLRGRAAHGMLTAALISTVLGTRLPGPGCIFLTQSMEFLAPVRIGDTVVARVTVTEMLDRIRKVTMVTECRVRDRPVLSGNVVVTVPAKPI